MTDMKKYNPQLKTILVTDDDKDVRWALSSLLKHEGFKVLEAENGTTALAILQKEIIDVMLLDFRMVGMDGMEILRAARKLGCDTPIIFLTGFGSTELASQAGKLGAFGFLTKPFKNEDIIHTVQMILGGQRHSFTQEDAPGVQKELVGPWKTIGTSIPSQKVHELINKVSPTNYTVVISGETGVGKELVARMIHHLSQRSHGPFVALDCGSIAPTLIESELFGHEKGAFTGANAARTGVFEAAKGGSLFLDEVTNLPLYLQAKLLRVIQERQVCRVGSTKPVNIDTRIITATNENITALVDAGDFRSDLYYRLNEFLIPVSPLRERPEDIIFLARKFILEACADLNKPVCTLTESAVKSLLEYPWPGNVRELRNVLRRAALDADSTVTPEHLNLKISPSPAITLPPDLPNEPECEALLSFKSTVRQKVSQTEKELLLKALIQTHGNMAEAARLLQIDYKTMREKTKEYQLSLHFKPRSIS